MKEILRKIGLLVLIACAWMACKNDSTGVGYGIVEPDEGIVVYIDTFSVTSAIDSCDAIISQTDSFLLGEIETDYGLLRASIMTQLACPEGFSYPEGAVIDSICLFLYYASWVGDKLAPLAIDAYQMDLKTFNYSDTYSTDLNVNEFCSRSKPVLTDRHIVVASEKLDSIAGSDGEYMPMVRMRVNDDFMNEFWSMQSFTDQDAFNEQFKGLLIETSFGSSTVLNVSDIAMGVYYHFDYSKNGKDTTVYDMKAFYSNSEVRAVNHLEYPDKDIWIKQLENDSNTYNYIIAPAGVYTRITFPLEEMSDAIWSHMIELVNDEWMITKQPYVNKAQVRIDVTNMYSGSESAKQRNDWLQPSAYMLLIREESMERFFAERELPSDTCALLSPLAQGKDSVGEATYYYSYDLSDFLTNQLRKDTYDKELKMMLVPVTVSTGTTSTSESAYSAVREQQTISATKILSAKNGMKLEIVYSGFSLPTIKD